jgi:hypothetical protein
MTLPMDKYYGTIKALNLQNVDGWESVFGNQTQRGAWGSAYWNAVVMKRASMTRAIPRVIDIDGRDEPVEENDIDIKFQNGIGGMMYRSSVSLDRHGAAYFVVVPTRGGKVHSVKWVDPSTIHVDFDAARGALRGFRRVMGHDIGTYFEYDEEEDIAIASSGLQLGWVWSLGLNEIGPGFVLEDMVQLPAGLLNSSDALMKALYDRGAIAQHVVFAPAEPPEQEKSRVLAKIRRALFGGLDSSNNVEVLSNQLSIEKVGTDPSALDLSSVDAGNMADVSAVGDLPRMLLDPDTGANRSLLDRVTSNFILNTIHPHAEHIADGYNHHVLTPLGMAIRLVPESMTINQEDEKLRANAFALYVSQGVPHETAAALLGIDVPEGMALVDDRLLQPAQADPMNEEVDPELDTDEGTDEDPAESEDEAKRVELGQFRRWYKKRMGTDPDQFDAKHLTRGDKLLIVDDILRTAWETYP